MHKIRGVIETWNEQIEELGREYIWVQAFENKGETMGCSQPHPHGPIWANSFTQRNRTQRAAPQGLLPTIWPQFASRLRTSGAKDGARIVVETEHWLAVVPYWAVWPFETLLLPKTHIRRMSELNDEQRDDLTLAIKTD